MENNILMMGSTFPPPQEYLLIAPLENAGKKSLLLWEQQEQEVDELAHEEVNESDDSEDSNGDYNDDEIGIAVAQAMGKSKGHSYC